MGRRFDRPVRPAAGARAPRRLGGRELCVARTAGEVASAFRPGLLAEAFVDGVEMSVESLLAGGELLFRNPTR